MDGLFLDLALQQVGAWPGLERLGLGLLRLPACLARWNRIALLGGHPWQCALHRLRPAPACKPLADRLPPRPAPQAARAGLEGRLQDIRAAAAGASERQLLALLLPAVEVSAGSVDGNAELLLCLKQLRQLALGLSPMASPAGSAGSSREGSPMATAEDAWGAAAGEPASPTRRKKRSAQSRVRARAPAALGTCPAPAHVSAPVRPLARAAGSSSRGWRQACPLRVAAAGDDGGGEGGGGCPGEGAGGAAAAARGCGGGGGLGAWL